MQAHGPKRFYTPQSLEFWFERLAGDWSAVFTPGQLDEGRRIYRDGEVRELELSARDAIVHRRIDKKDEYAVIEWPDSGLSVRSSSTDRDLAHALAVAGLHEIEELVADEILPVPEEHTGGEGNGRSISMGGGAGTPVPAHESSLQVAGAPQARIAGGNGNVSRPLGLVFKTKAAGLAFQAYWIDGGGKGRQPALGLAAHAGGNGHISSGERAKLIGLAAYARKAHFQYDQETGAYLLESLAEIPNFLKATLPAWRRIFAVELDERAAKLLKGTRPIEIEAVAERAPGGSSDGAGLNLRWIFRSGERLLTESEVSALLKRGGSR